MKTQYNGAEPAEMVQNDGSDGSDGSDDRGGNSGNSVVVVLGVIVSCAASDMFCNVVTVTMSYLDVSSMLLSAPSNPMTRRSPFFI